MTDDIHPSRRFTTGVIALLNLAHNLAEQEDFEAWNEKRQRMEPAVDVAHIAAALARAEANR